MHLFFLLKNRRYPFDYKTHFGFILAYFFQSLVGFTVVFLFVLQMNFAAGFIWFAYAFTADLTECLRELNFDLERLQNEKTTVAKQIQMNKRIAGVVRFHSKATKYSILLLPVIHSKYMITL